MAWHRSGDKWLSELMMISLLTPICVTRPQWVNKGAKNWRGLWLSSHPRVLSAEWLYCCLDNVVIFNYLRKHVVVHKPLKVVEFIFWRMLGWWFDGRKICMVTHDCDAPCTVAGDGDWLYHFFYLSRDTEIRQKIVVMTKPELVLINMFSPTCVPNLMTSIWKISPGMTKLISSFN